MNNKINTNLNPNMSNEIKKSQEDFHKMRIEKIAKVNFDISNIENYEKFKELVMKALRFNSLARVKCHYSTWKKLSSFPNESFKLMEIELACDILENSTPSEMEMSLVEYNEMIENFVISIKTEIAGIIMSIDDKIKREIDAKLIASKSIPIGKSLFGNNKNTNEE